MRLEEQGRQMAAWTRSIDAPTGKIEGGLGVLAIGEHWCLLYMSRKLRGDYG
jgi:hypothetical protein